MMYGFMYEWTQEGWTWISMWWETDRLVDEQKEDCRIIHGWLILGCGWTDEEWLIHVEREKWMMEATGRRML